VDDGYRLLNFDFNGRALLGQRGWPLSLDLTARSPATSDRPDRNLPARSAKFAAP